jgi:hypothetical protein
MSIKTVATNNGFQVVALGNPFAKKQVAKPGKIVPKVAPKKVLVGKPAPKIVKPVAKPTGKLYGNAANGKSAGILKLAAKWAIADRDPETRKVMTQIAAGIKKIIWSHLTEEKKKELEKL